MKEYLKIDKEYLNDKTNLLKELIELRIKCARNDELIKLYRYQIRKVCSQSEKMQLKLEEEKIMKEYNEST